MKSCARAASAIATPRYNVGELDVGWRGGAAIKMSDAVAEGLQILVQYTYCGVVERDQTVGAAHLI
jgi:hypothetical protein